MRKAKKIISYCKNGYTLNKSNYSSMVDLLEVANEVADAGNIPTCRRAINLLNHDSKINYKIKINISKKTQREIDIKNQLKLLNSGSLLVEHGKYIVDFN